MDILKRRSHKFNTTLQKATVLSQSDKKCYNTTSSNRGMVNIIKIGTPDFIADSIYPDTFDVDADNLRNVFTQLGMNVSIHFEKQKGDCVLKTFAEENQLKTADMAILFVMGHGERVDGREYIFAWDDDEKIYYDDIIESFKTSLGDNMQGKLKLLFFEIGREDDADYSLQIEFIEETSMLVVYSTVTVYENWYSSMSLPYLCKELMNSAHKLDLISILEKIIDDINKEKILKDSGVIECIWKVENMPLLFFNPGLYQNETGNVCEFDTTDKCGYIKCDQDFTPLHCAIENGDLDTCRILLENVSNIDEEYKRADGLTLLHLASYHGYFEIAELLLSKNVDINKVDGEHWSCLHYASSGGYLDMIKFLIFKNVDKHVSTENNLKPLHCAVQRGHLNCCEEFVDSIADIDERYKLKDDGMTLLQLAAKHGQIKTAEWILSKGVDIETVDVHQWTALHHAAYDGHLGMVRFLLGKGAKRDASDETNFTPLHCSVRKGYLSIAKELLEEGVDIDVKYALSDDGMTLLHLASIMGFVDVFEWLRSKGAGVNISSSTDWTCLHKAALKGHLEIVKMLLEAGAWKEGCNEYNYSPIQYAVSEGHVNVVELLLDDNVDLNTNYLQDGLTLLHVACRYGHVEMAKYLISKGVSIDKPSRHGTGLHYAATRGHLKMVKFLLESGANRDGINQEKATPLHCAVNSDHIDVAKLLLSKEVDINSIDKNGWTALHHSAHMGNLSMVQLLVSKGADRRIANNKHLIPLHYAVSRGHVEVFNTLFDDTKSFSDYKVKKSEMSILQLASKYGQIAIGKFLLKNCDINETDKNGWTALHYACNSGKIEMVKFLIDKGADRNIRNKSKKLPVDLALRNGHRGICDFLNK